jgi:chaperonin GroES
MKTLVKPMADRILVKEDETTSSSEIIILSKETVRKGTVVAVGPGKKDEPLQVVVGDHVMFGKNIGTEIELEKEKYLLMRESDLFLIL